MIQLRVEDIRQDILEDIRDWLEVFNTKSPARYTMKYSKRQEWSLANPLCSNSKDYVQELYTSGYGLKVLAREIGVTYTVIRRLFSEYWGIQINHGVDITYQKTRDFRSKKAKEDPNNPFKDWLNKQKRTRTEYGVQGYFVNKKGIKIWLRSTYEYIYCKWLDANDIDYKYEEVTYTLSNGEKYRPDFFLGDNQIVEVKGNYYSNRRYKVEMLKQENPEIKIVIVDRIDSYTKIGYKKELLEWKQVRLLS